MMPRLRRGGEAPCAFAAIAAHSGKSGDFAHRQPIMPSRKCAASRFSARKLHHDMLKYPQANCARRICRRPVQPPRTRFRQGQTAFGSPLDSSVGFCKMMRASCQCRWIKAGRCSENLAKPHSLETHIPVGGVIHRLKSGRGYDLRQLGPPPAQQRAQQAKTWPFRKWRNGSHRSQTAHSGAAGQPHE